MRSTLLQIYWPGLSGSFLHDTEELDELPPKAMKGFPPPPPEPAIESQVNIWKMMKIKV
jgi:hypothetical protein